jgi:hypothetical protein
MESHRLLLAGAARFGVDVRLASKVLDAGVGPAAWQPVVAPLLVAMRRRACWSRGPMCWRSPGGASASDGSSRRQPPGAQVVPQSDLRLRPTPGPFSCSHPTVRGPAVRTMPPGSHWRRARRAAPVPRGRGPYRRGWIEHTYIARHGTFDPDGSHEQRPVSALRESFVAR